MKHAAMKYFLSFSDHETNVFLESPMSIEAVINNI